jgi:hypothetical protein
MLAGRRRLLKSIEYLTAAGRVVAQVPVIGRSVIDPVRSKYVSARWMSPAITGEKPRTLDALQRPTRSLPMLTPNASRACATTSSVTRCARPGCETRRAASAQPRKIGASWDEAQSCAPNA